MRELFRNFCENSSVHGFPYIFKKNKTVSEKIFWTVLLTTAIFLLVIQVFWEWERMLSSTVVVVVENPHYDLSAIEFPAVTVCPNINVISSKAESLIKSYNLSEKNHSSFRNSLIALSLMRVAYYNLPLDYVNSINGNLYPIKSKDFKHIMYEVKPDLNTMIDSCTWKSKRVECNKLFRPQFMLEGYCYSFNSKTAVRSTQDPIDLPPFELPNKTLVGFKTSMFGITSGISFHLRSLAHETLNNTLFGDYYTVIVHDPVFLPDLSKMYTIPSNDPFNRHYIGVFVEIVEADQSLSNMEESLRNCQLVNNSKMFSRVLECKIYSILNYCHCLPYYFHDLKKESDVCGLRHLKCLSDLTAFFRTYGVPKGTPGFPDWIQSWDTLCPCVQPCSYTEYNSKLDVDQTQINNIDVGWTRVDIFYNTLAVKYSRRASYVFRDFIVNCGSFANLLLGFSAVAAVDFFILFFKLTKRAFVELCMKKSRTRIIRKPKKNRTCFY